jgi:hypothetical protein
VRGNVKNDSSFPERGIGTTEEGGELPPGDTWDGLIVASFRGDGASSVVVTAVKELSISGEVKPLNT